MINLNKIIYNYEYLYNQIKIRNIFIDLFKISDLLFSRKIILNELKFIQQKKHKKNISSTKTYFRIIKDIIKIRKYKINDIEYKLYSFGLIIPNVLNNKTIIGRSEAENLLIKKCNQKYIKKQNYDHLDIGYKKRIFDFSTANCTTTSNFLFMKKKGAALNRYIASYIMKFHELNKDVEINSPILVNEKSLIGTGQFPKFKKDVFTVKNTKKKLFLIPTAEVPLTNYFRCKKVTIKRTIRLFSHTPCFRLEAGSAGKINKGLIRLHQFEKIEMVRFSYKENVRFELQLMINRVQKILNKIAVSHKIIKLCSGDTGFTSKITYDIEVWMPSINNFCEISSCSAFGDFQSRRSNIKVKSTIGKKYIFLHTLNGSGLPLGRTLAALLENTCKTNNKLKLPICLL